MFDSKRRKLSNGLVNKFGKTLRIVVVGSGRVVKGCRKTALNGRGGVKNWYRGLFKHILTENKQTSKEDKTKHIVKSNKPLKTTCLNKNKKKSI